jgi:hypothetical protein
MASDAAPGTLLSSLLSPLFETDHHRLHCAAVTMGKLHLVDLAGSERLVRSVVEGQNKKEAQQINASLTALGKLLPDRCTRAWLARLQHAGLMRVRAAMQLRVQVMCSRC